MVKLSEGDDEGIVDDEVPEVPPQQGNERDAEGSGAKMLAEMKAGGGGDIHRGIAVMHPVKPPQHRQQVVGAVPEIHPGVQQQQGEDELQRRAQGNLCE